MQPLGLTQAAVGLTGRSVRAGWGLASRAFDLLSPVAARPRVPGVVRMLTVAGDDGAERARDAAEPAAGVSAHRLADPILFLDGETGARVATAFLVENEREEAVSAPIKVSAFSGPDGLSAAPVVTVSPTVLELGPGEQALVQVAAILGPELQADVRYVARISIPGLSEATVPIAARRRVAEAALTGAGELGAVFRALAPRPRFGAAQQPRRWRVTVHGMGGFDDDDDLQRRDLGPRPEVPNHGARPVLIGIPILLITTAAILAIVFGGGDDNSSNSNSNSGSGSGAATTASGSGDASTDQAVAAVRASGDVLAGRAEPSAFADATCEPTDGMDFRCAFGGEGDPDSGAIRIRLQDDGSVTKILGTVPATAGQKTSAQTQTLLTDDDAASGASEVTYTCATSTAINPDGTSAGSTATGYRCVLVDPVAQGDDKIVGQRYVEFAADGTARRDFMLKAE